MSVKKWNGTNMKAIITIILSLQVSLALACHCRYLCPYWAWEDSGNILVAKVISRDTIWEHVDENRLEYGRFDSLPLIEYTIRVKQNIKGNLELQTHKIVTEVDRGACGQVFHLGKNYVIFLNEYRNHKLFTSDCDRNTRKISKEKKALKNRKNNEEQCGRWRKRRPSED